jgi:cytochrome c oxidase subunit 3
MSERRVLDVSSLPTYAFGPRDLMFWGTAVGTSIEAAFTALLLVAYFYIRGNYDVWPPIPPGPRAFHAGLAAALLLAASLIPWFLAARAARREQLRPTRMWLLLGVVLGAGYLAARVCEMTWVDFRWDANAHASLFWTIQIIQAFSGTLDLLESVLFVIVLFKGPVEKQHFVDIQSDGIFWGFVVVSGVAQFLLLYLDSTGPLS